MVFLRKIIYLLLIAVGTTILLYSCKSDSSKSIPDVSNIKINLHFDRYDKALMEIDTTKGTADIDKVIAQFPEVSRQLAELLRDASTKKSTEQEVLLNYAKNPVAHLIYDTCNVVYPDFKQQKEKLTSAFQFYKYYFPKRLTPQVVTFTSEYSLGNFTIADSIVGIGLDFFLGENHIAYPSIFPNYIKRFLNKDHLASKAIEAIATNIVGVNNSNTMLDNMIYSGKILYIVDKLMPYEQDSVKFTFSKEQMQWCKDNEFNIWQFFIEQKLLYSTEPQMYRKYVDYSPNSPGMPGEAPGRTACFIGYKIIENFMDKNPNTTMEELLLLNDSQAILSKAKYKPSK